MTIIEFLQLPNLDTITDEEIRAHFKDAIEHTKVTLATMHDAGVKVSRKEKKALALAHMEQLGLSIDNL